MGQIDSFLTGLGKKGQGRPCRKNEFLGEDEREMEKLKSLWDGDEDAEISGYQNRS